MVISGHGHASHMEAGGITQGQTQRFGLQGAVHVHRYRSQTLGRTRRLHVYTPPDYDPKAARRYPVLYLLHGTPGDDANWTDYGDARGALDRLIAAGKCVPCIVVMPDGEVPRKRYGAHGFERELLESIIPWIEHTYPAQSGAGGRAIAGLSMGGFQSIEIGLNHLDTFGWIGVFSAGLREGWVTTSDLGSFNAGRERSRARLKLLYLRIGKQDFFLHDARRFDAWLSRRSVPHIYQEVPGDHDWNVWRSALIDFVPRLFTNGPKRI